MAKSSPTPPPVEPKSTPDVTGPTKIVLKKKINGTTLGLGLVSVLLVVSLGVIGYFGFIGKTAECIQAGGCPADEADEEDTEEAETDEDLEVSEIEGEECPECAELSSYFLELGDSGGITVPEGWYVSKFVSDYEINPDDLIDVLPVPYNGGWYQIHEATLIELTNDTSTITMSSSETMMLGAFGAEMGELESGYTVFLEPGIGDPNRAGGARKLDGTEYVYELVYTCDDPVMCGDYGVVNGEIPYDRFIFEGAAGDLSTADDLFEEAFVDGGFDAKES